jgi:hypothetical protein
MFKPTIVPAPGAVDRRRRLLIHWWIQASPPRSNELTGSGMRGGVMGMD